MTNVLITRSNPIAPDPRVEKVAASLLGAGYAVRLLGWDRTGALPPREQVAGAECARLPIRARYGTGMANLPALLRWQWGLFRWLARHRRQLDVIHACDFDTVLPALLCKRLWGVKVVYDIFDFYADHLRATPEWVRRWIRALDRWAIRQADALILADEARFAQVGDRLPANCAVILNTPPDVLALVNHEGHEESQRVVNASCPSWLKIIYVGLLQVERGLLDVIAVLRDHPRWHLDIGGYGGDEGRIRQAAESLPNVTWHGRIPYTRTLELTAAADVVLALYDPALLHHRLASPNKLFEAMMLGKPVLAAAGTGMDAVIERERCGLLIPYGNRAALADALARLAADPALRRELGRNGRRAYEQRYSWDEMQRRLLLLYAALGPRVAHHEAHQDAQR